MVTMTEDYQGITAFCAQKSTLLAACSTLLVRSDTTDYKLGQFKGPSSGTIATSSGLDIDGHKGTNSALSHCYL